MNPYTISAVNLRQEMSLSSRPLSDPPVEKELSSVKGFTEDGKPVDKTTGCCPLGQPASEASCSEALITVFLYLTFALLPTHHPLWQSYV